MTGEDADGDALGIERSPGRPPLDSSTAEWAPLTREAIAYKRSSGSVTWQDAAKRVGISVRQLIRWRGEFRRMEK